MAQRMNGACALGLALGVACASVRAQGLSDPTRPPGFFLPGEREAEMQNSRPQLQSILIAPGRRLAVINGQTVVLGGRIGDATLYAVSETSVVLKRGQQLETLRLLPDVDKKPARPPAAHSKGGDSR